MTSLRRPTLLVVSTVTAGLVLGAAAPTARADTRAWKAAKKVLPGGLQAVVGMNVGALRNSQLFTTLVDMVRARAVDKSSDAKSLLDRLHKSCGLDLAGNVDSAVVGTNADEQGAVIIALKGVTRRKLEACAIKLSAEDGEPFKIAKDGALTRYLGPDGKAVFVRWLGKDVVEVATDASDKDLSAKMATGGVTRDKAIAKGLGHVKTTAGLWLVVHKPTPLDQLNAKMELAYGSADVTKGNIALNLHLVLDSATAATQAATKATSQLNTVKQAGQVPPAFLGLVAALAITSSGPELVITDTAPESQVLSVIKMFVH